MKRGRLGLSTTLGTAFFVVLMILSLNLVLYAVTQYDSFLGLASSVSDLERERSSEGLSISDIRADNSKLNVTATNRGKLPLKILTLWATQWNGTGSDWHRSFAVDIYLAPGNTTKNIGQSLTQSFSTNKIYNVKLVTTRGNIASATYVPLPTNIAPGYVNTGYLTIAFSVDSFKYTRAGSSTLRTAWNPPATDTCVVWHVEFVNHGAQDIKLYKYSVLSFVQVKTSATQLQFFIVDPSVVYVNGCSQQDSVTPYPSTPTQVVPKNAQGDSQTGGPPTWVKFSATSPGGDKPQSGSWNPGDEYMVLIVMYYLYGPTEKFTQLIPFAGVIFV